MAPDFPLTFVVLDLSLLCEFQNVYCFGMSVVRLYLNPSSSDITWKCVPSIPSILLVSDNSEEEDGDDEKDEDDKHL